MIHTSKEPSTSAVAYARSQDEQDALRGFRADFHLPDHAGTPALYFNGNSLGLMPRTVADALQTELDSWARYGGEGHFKGPFPWVDYHQPLQPMLAQIVGAMPLEVIAMQSLTANLHFAMVSFYRPEKGRYKVLMEAGAFPSDQYALDSQVRYHGYNPEETIITVEPQPGGWLPATDAFQQAIEQYRDELALVLIGGVHYFTGEWYDLAGIAATARRYGIPIGYDLAHAVGNVPLQLHDWGVDFAVWCSYKYLNSGPGGPGGLFVHERHARSISLPRFAGWWGHDRERRFEMEPDFVPMVGAAGWQLSNVPVLTFAAHRAALTVHTKAGMTALRQKSEVLTGFLYEQLTSLQQRGAGFQIITPAAPDRRGCQLSLYVEKAGKSLFDALTAQGVFCDWREDHLSESGGGVIRVAPVPLYNTFGDVLALSQLMERRFFPSGNSTTT